MSVFNWPSTWFVEHCSIKLEPNIRVFEGTYTKSWFGIDLLGERFVMTGRLPIGYSEDGGSLEAFFNKLRGVHFISAWHFARSQPIGTQRGAPTLSTSVAQGASVLPLTGLTNGATLLAGDMLGVSSQLFQVADDVTVSGTTANVNTVNRARAGISSGVSVVWDKPVANWRMMSQVPVSYEGNIHTEIDFELVQVW